MDMLSKIKSNLKKFMPSMLKKRYGHSKRRRHHRR